MIILLSTAVYGQVKFIPEKSIAFGRIDPYETDTTGWRLKNYYPNGIGLRSWNDTRYLIFNVQHSRIWSKDDTGTNDRYSTSGWGTGTDSLKYATTETHNGGKAQGSWNATGFSGYIFDAPVGIGTTAAPNGLLHISGSNPLIRLSNTATSGVESFVQNIRDVSGNRLRFYLGAYMMALWSNAGLCIGVNYLQTIGPANGLAVEGNAGFGTSTPDKQIGIGNGTDEFSMAVVSDKFTLYNDNATPAAIYSVDSVGNIIVAGTITGNALTRGTNAFTTTAETDTVIISGASVNDFYTITLTGTAAPSANDAIRLEVIATGFVLHRSAAGTSGLTYFWEREL